MNDLRTGFLERHRKRLHEAIDIVPPPAKRVYLERAEEDPEMEAPPSTMPQSNEEGSNVAAATQPNVIGPSVAVVVQPDVAAPSNAPAAEEVRGKKGGSDAAVTEEASDEKNSPAPTAPPSWEEMMEMLKGVSCFTDTEAPSTKMSDFFPLTKRVSINIGGDPPTFVKAWLPFGTPKSVVSCIQHLQEWTIPNTAEVVIPFMLHSPSSSFFSNAYSIAWYYLRLLLPCPSCGWHPLYDAYT